MAWITPPKVDPEIGKKLRDLYPGEYFESVPELQDRGHNDGDVSIHAFNPDQLLHTFAGYGHALRGKKLSRTQQELIATLVSSLNSCYH